MPGIFHYHHLILLVSLGISVGCEEPEQSQSDAGMIGATERGVCCGDSCSLSTRASCEATLGLFRTAESCDPDPCPFGAFGACCQPDGQCVDLEANTCLTAGGNFQGAGRYCSTANICTVPEVGACCDPFQGTCAVENEQACNRMGKVFMRDGLSCDPDPCDTVILGACCRDNACTQIDEARCRGEFSPEAECSVALCPPAPDAGLDPDAGHVDPDAAAPMPDAASPEADADAPMPDAAAPMPDADAPMPDAAAPMPDAAAPMPDAAAPMPDAMPDAMSNLDAAPP